MPDTHSSQCSRLAVALLLPLLALPPAARAQTSTVAVDADTLQKLVQRVNELEAEVKALKAAPAAVASAPTAGPTSAATAPSTGAAAQPVMLPPPEEDHYPKLSFDLLGDVVYAASTDHADRSTFVLGDVDPVASAILSPRTSVTGEFVVAADQEGFAFETERLVLHYQVNDFLGIDAGRFHTNIGYYNAAYKNGTYFQTTTERPKLFAFEDDEGILPIHSNGVSLSGDIPSGQWGLRYVAEVANGRDYSVGVNPFHSEDDNTLKAVNFALSSRPAFLPGTIFGASLYHDTLTPEGLPRTEQWILAGYAVYKTPKMEWLNEVAAVRHTPKGGESHTTTAGYSQFSRRFGNLRPYVRLEGQNAPKSDELLALSEQNMWMWGAVVGVRYDFTPMMALKGEYLHWEHEMEGAEDELRFQWTFRY